MNFKGPDKPDIVLAYAIRFKIVLRRIMPAAFAAALVACAAPPADPESAPEADAAANEQVQMALIEARTAAEIGEYDKSLAVLESVLDQASDPEVARQAAQIGAALGDWSAVERATRRWLALEPDSASAAQFATVAALRQGNAEAASALLRDGLLAAGGEPDFNQVIGLLVSSGEPELAEQVIDQLIGAGLEPVPGRGLYLKSRLAWHFEQPARAEQLAAAAVSVNPDFEHSMWAARVARELEQPEQALDFLGKAAEARPGDRSVLANRVEMLRELGRLDQATSLLKEMGDDPDALYSLGLVYNEMGRQAEAGAAWQRLVSLGAEQRGPRHAWLSALLAELLGMREQAVQWYARVEGQEAGQATIRRALLLADSGDLAAARGLLGELRMSANPELAERAWLAEAQLLAELDNEQAALDLLSESLRRFPGSIDLLYSRAMTAVNAGQIELAEQDLRAIIQNDPDNAIALNALGYTLSDLTDRQREAYRLIESAINLEPDNPAILDSMGWVLYRLGRTEEALPYLERAARMEPHPEIVSHLIEVLWQLNQQQRARELIASVRQDFEGEEVFDRTLERLGIE